MSLPFIANPEPLYRNIARLLCNLIYSPKYKGFEQIPKWGAAVLISNHVSYVDGLVIAGGVERPVRFVIDTEIYNLPFVNYVMKYNRAIPISPTRESVMSALDEIASGLAAGDLICIFPEGQLTYTGSLGRFKTGIESIIKRSQVPVYPIALNGLWGSMFSRKFRGSLHRWIPKNPLHPVTAICGEPIPADMVTVNFLQQAVMRLKYQFSQSK